MVHTLTYNVHVHRLFNACTTEAISTVNSPVTPSDKFMIAIDSAYVQESANRYIHALELYVVPNGQINGFARATEIPISFVI